MITEIRTIAQFANLVAAARIAKGLTQADLARVLGTDQAWVSQFESGRIKGIKTRRILQIAEALGITITASFEAASFDATEKPKTSFPLPGISRDFDLSSFIGRRDG